MKILDKIVYGELQSSSILSHHIDVTIISNKNKQNAKLR
jgi:hypothetical protein